MRTADFSKHMAHILTLVDETATGMDSGYVSTFEAALSADGTTAINSSTQTLPGEITTGALAQVTYYNAAGASTANSAGTLKAVVFGSYYDYDSNNNTLTYLADAIDRLSESLSNFIEISITGTSASSTTIRRGILRSNSGQMRYIFDLPSPLVLVSGSQFRIDFRHNLEIDAN